MQLGYLAIGDECANSIDVVDANDTVVASLINEENEITPSMRAYAALFAAAPELLEALQFYVSICGNTAYQVSRATAQDMYDKATAAIAKAEGQ